MPKKETKILLIAFLLTDIIFICIFVFLFYFTKNLIAESINGEDQIKKELKNEDITALMKNDLVSGKMYQEKLNNYMVPSGGTIDFIKILEQLISNTGLKFDIKNISTEASSKGDSTGTELIKINMDATGEWKNVQFFLALLENYPLKIDINSISLSKFSDYVVNGKNVPQWSLDLEFTVVKIKDVK